MSDPGDVVERPGGVIEDRITVTDPVEAELKPQTPSERLRQVEASFKRDPKLYPATIRWLIDRVRETIQGDDADAPQPADASRAIADYLLLREEHLASDCQIKIVDATDALVKALEAEQERRKYLHAGFLEWEKKAVDRWNLKAKVEQRAESEHTVAVSCARAQDLAEERVKELEVQLEAMQRE